MESLTVTITDGATVLLEEVKVRMEKVNLRRKAVDPFSSPPCENLSVTYSLLLLPTLGETVGAKRADGTSNRCYEVYVDDLQMTQVWLCFHYGIGGKGEEDRSPQSTDQGRHVTRKKDHHATTCLL